MLEQGKPRRRWKIWLRGILAFVKVAIVIFRAERNIRRAQKSREAERLERIRHPERFGWN